MKTLVFKRLSKCFFLCFVFGFLAVAAFRVDAAALTWCTQTYQSGSFYFAAFDAEHNVDCIYNYNGGATGGYEILAGNSKIEPYTPSLWSLNYKNHPLRCFEGYIACAVVKLPGKR